MTNPSETLPATEITTDRRLHQLLTDRVDPEVEVAPLHVRLHLDANRATPILAAMLAKVLIDAGARVTVGDARVDPIPTERQDLKGLHIHIGTLTWVTDPEAARWERLPTHG